MLKTQWNENYANNWMHTHTHRKRERETDILYSLQPCQPSKYYTHTRAVIKLKHPLEQKQKETKSVP